MSEELSFNLTQSPGHLLHRAQQFAADRFADATNGVEVTPRQFAVLTAVAEDEGLTQTQLVKVTGIDRSTLAELVARMASRGLLMRERAAGDARANAVRLTEVGRELFEAARNGAAAADDAILSALPKNKRANFVDSLIRIAQAVEGEPPLPKKEIKKAKVDSKDKDKKKKDAKKKKKKKD